MRSTGVHARRWVGGRHPLLVSASLRDRWTHTAVWITAALARGERVVYKTSCTDRQAAVVGQVADALRESDRRGPVEVVDLLEAPGFERIPPAEAVVGWHAGKLQQALDAGFKGVAFAGEHHPWPTARSHPDRYLSCERTLDQLSLELGVRALCHYDGAPHTPQAIGALLRLHFHAVNEPIWGACVVDNRLAVSGEIDLSNANRFGEVLEAAAQAGITTVDLAEIQLLSAAAMNVLAGLATRLHRHGRFLALVGAPPLTLRTLLVARLHTHPGLRVLPGPGDQCFPADSQRPSTRTIRDPSP
jgi:anti-anti-sigma factor